MRGKDKSLLYLITSLVLLVVIIAVMIAVPRLRNLGEDLSQKAISRLNNLDNSNISVTSAPYALPDYMWDAEIYGSQPVNLRPLISSTAMVFPDILNDTGLRIRVGQEGRAYTFSLYWDSGIRETALTLTLFDRLERPLEYASQSSGILNAVVPGGLYKLGISSDGKLGESFSLKATAEPTSQQPDFDNPGPSGIPTIDIQMSDAIFRTWDIQRDKLYQEIIKNQQWVDTSNFEKVLADISFLGTGSSVQLWAAGSGDPTHFSSATPSFSGKIISGPLLFGITNFKLYSIRTQEGLYNDIVESIIYDEGIFVPRFLLVNSTLNGRGLGLYLLVETPGSDGFFSGVSRYAGLIQDWEGNAVANPQPSDGMTDQEPIADAEIPSVEFTAKINQEGYAKTLALVSRFEATHGLSEGDIRWYLNPYLNAPEPVLRDLNAGTSPLSQEGAKSILIHTGWWMGPRLIGTGPHFNPKVFSSNSSISEYLWYPTTLAVGTVHNSAYEFVRNDKNREIFERYLSYACDKAFQLRFASRIKSAYGAAMPYLDSTGKRPLPELSQTYMNEAKSETEWLQRQVEAAVSGKSSVVQVTPLLFERSALLVSDLQEQETNSDTRAITLYNLSPFSARIKLPDYTSVTKDATSLVEKNGNGLYLSPSTLFPTVITVSTNASEGITDPSLLTRSVAERLLTLERIYYSTRGAPEASIPFIDVTIPAARYNDFVSFLSTASLVTLGDFYTLPPQRNLLLNNLPIMNPGDRTTAPYNANNNPDIIILPLGMEQISPKVTRLSLLITNYSADNVSLELNDLRWTDANDLSYEIPRTIHAIWQLGDTPEKLTTARVNLGASANISRMSDSILDSPMLWTGALAGYINGSADGALPDAVMVQYDFSIQETTCQWIQTDANGLVKSAASSRGAIRVAIHEPFRVYLPGQNTKMQELTGYRSPGTSTQISVSSYYKEHVNSNLVDGNADTIWHVRYPPDTTRHWVRFDFGAPLTIEGIAVLPHFKLVNQLWDKDHALLQGSNDPITKGWTNLAQLSNDKATPVSQDWGWLDYSVPNENAFRYYRIFIDDLTFLSLAEVKFKVKEWQPPAEISINQMLAQGILTEKNSPNSPGTLIFSGKNTTISGMIIIPKGYLLKIEPGTTIRFTEDAGIISYSPIEAVGTMENPIKFGPAEAGKSWRGIAVVKATVASKMAYVTMTGASAGSAGKVQFTGGLTFMKTKVKLVNVSLVDFTSEDGLHVSNSFFDITGLSIQNSYSDGLDSDWSCGTISDSISQNNGGDGIDLSGSRATITNCVSRGNADKGISIGEGSVAQVINCHLLDNRTGVAAKDQSAVKITGSVITGNHYGVLQYIKKPVYIFPVLLLDKNEIKDNETNIYKEDPGTWTRAFD